VQTGEGENKKKRETEKLGDREGEKK